MQFDWRWIVVIAIVILLLNPLQLPPLLLGVLLAAGGGWILRRGWQVWQGGGRGPSGTRVTYWRGQRIEVKPQRRASMPNLSSIGPAAIYLLIGGAMVISAGSILFRALQQL